VTVIGAPLLLAISPALARIPIENDDLQRALPVHDTIRRLHPCQSLPPAKSEAWATQIIQISMFCGFLYFGISERCWKRS